ncbi:hypothetical protein [Nocardiopsis suaedae]|uniref:DUF4263 domain-containing protein n=1 Tax=Nocardiopsis suaedae TaxID=3018444 RepID=A0ABT4TJX2_9ACTN|nr:hypothetical protein [Nocardiopsis suaedae]MDA2804973.1 hypothetical protein [Nocardiopsis suaedae]
MRLLSLDFDPVYGEADRSTFSSDISAFDYDVVIWDPASSLGSYSLHIFGEYYRGRPSLDEHDSVRIQSDARRRRVEFIEYLNSGRTLVMIVRPPQLCYVDTGNRSYSGTGKNRVTTRHLESFNLLSAFPLEQTKFSPAAGTRIEFDGSGPIVDLLKKYKNHLSYDAFVKDAPGAAVAHVAGTDRVVSSMLRSKGGGYLILIPAIDLRDESGDEDDEDSDEEGWLSQAPEFQADLLAAISQLSGSKSMSRPQWIARYTTDEQEGLRVEIVKQQKQIEKVRAKLADLQRQKEFAEAKDQLFLGTGRALELEVKSVLELLGGAVTEPAPGRDDWKVSFPEGDAVVEVKGIKKSAAEKHAAQLEKWVATALEETEKAPKGILAVNTWRERPLDERTEADFPDQMIPYCEGRQHCLVTGLQFFVIRDDVEKNPERAEHWRRELLNTVGRMTGCDDWRSVLRETRSEDG